VIVEALQESYKKLEPLFACRCRTEEGLAPARNATRSS